MSQTRDALQNALVLALLRKDKEGLRVEAFRSTPTDERLKEAEYSRNKEGAERVAYFFQDRMARRVAGRFMFTAALHDELVRKMEGLFSKFTEKEAAEIAAWFKDNFRFQISKTPQGQRDLKEKAAKFYWFLNQAGGFRPGLGTDEEAWLRGGKEAARLWESEIKPMAGDLVRYFTDEGGKIIPKEVQSGGNTYVNKVGFDQKKFGQYVTAIENVFDDLKGWRRKALTGGVRVILAGPKDFRGTSGGFYRSSEDALYIRATPAVLKRSQGSYGSFDYIVVHELGHRYEYKNHVPFDFDRSPWYSTDYSRKEGESFAELFALSNFRLKGAWDEVVERFEDVIAGKKEAPAA